MKLNFKGIIKCAFFAAILGAILSCTAKTEEKNATYIDIEGALGKGRVIPLSEIAEEVTVIPLETADTLLVGDISWGNNFFSYENGHFYIMDMSETVWIFDKEGKFFNKFNRKGRGPEEFPRADGIEVEPETGNVIVFFNGIDFYEYRMDGSFIRKIDTPNDESVRAAILNYGFKVNKNLYFVSAEALPEREMSVKGDKRSLCAVTFDSLSNIRAKIYFPEAESAPASSASQNLFQVHSGQSGFSSVVITPNAHFFRYRNNIRIKYMFDNIITTVNEKGEHDTVYNINFGKYATTRDFVNNENQTGVDLDSKVITVYDVMESDNNLYFLLEPRGLAHNPYENTETARDGTQSIRKTTSCYALFNKKSGEFHLMERPEGGNKMGFLDDISGGPVFWPKYISSEEYLVSFCTALDFIEYAENKDASEKIKKIASKLDENDNPVVVLVKLKY